MKKGSHHTPKSRKKMKDSQIEFYKTHPESAASRGHKGSDHPLWGTHCSEATKQKMRITMKITMKKRCALKKKAKEENEETTKGEHPLGILEAML